MNVYCEECGKETLDGSRFCVHCGHHRRDVEDGAGAVGHVEGSPQHEPAGPPDGPAPPARRLHEGTVEPAPATGPPASMETTAIEGPRPSMEGGHGPRPERRSMWVLVSVLVVVTIVVAAVLVLYPRGGGNENEGTVDLHFIGEEPDTVYNHILGRSYFEVEAPFTNDGTRKLDPETDVETYVIYHLNDAFYSRVEPFNVEGEGKIHDGVGTSEAMFIVDTTDLHPGDHVEIFCFISYKDNVKDDLVFDKYYSG